MLVFRLYSSDAKQKHRHGQYQCAIQRRVRLLKCLGRSELLYYIRFACRSSVAECERETARVLYRTD